MKKCSRSLLFAFSSLFLAGAAASAAPCGSVTGNIVTNCGFETGNFSGWTLGGQLSGGLNGNYYGVQTSPVNSGKYAAYFGTNVTTVIAPTTLTQQLTGPAGYDYSLSFYIDQHAGVVGTSAFPISFSVTFGSSPVSSIGQALTTNGFLLQSFLVHDYSDTNPILKFSFLNAPDYYFLDDVSVVRLGAVAPEAGSVVLTIGGLAALLLAQAARRGNLFRVLLG